MTRSLGHVGGEGIGDRLVCGCGFEHLDEVVGGGGSMVLDHQQIGSAMAHS